jgi:hypothetical protein
MKLDDLAVQLGLKTAEGFVRGGRQDEFSRTIGCCIR